MTKENYIVIEGNHKDPNNYNTMHNSSRKVYGPLSETKAKELAMMLNQKNTMIRRATNYTEFIKVATVI